MRFALTDSPFRLRVLTATALLFVFLLITACQPAEPQGELPTLAILPSLTPTATTVITSTPPPTSTPLPTETPTITSTPTSTLIPTRTPSPTITPSITIEPTFAAQASATMAVQEIPRFSTFTPAPSGSQLPGTPAMLADVVITEQQFQEEVNRRIASNPAIERALVNFVPDGIEVELTALGGEAFITGNVLLTIQLSGDLATIAIGDIRVNAPQPPEGYVQLVSGDFFLMMVDVLDSILKQRLGPEQKLRYIAVTDSTIEVTLLVPQAG